MKARQVFHEKRVVSRGAKLAVAELKVWSVPASEHYPTGAKFSLFLVVDGAVVVGFDNHRPKGPHLHLRDDEHPYSFTTIERLIDDFWEHAREAGFEP